MLAGTGGTVALGLLTKRQPIDVHALLPAIVGDVDVGPDHPVLALVQEMFDIGDPVNFVRHVAREPLPGVPARNVLHVYGTDDSYAPVETQRTVATAADLPVVGPVVDDFGLAPVAAPAHGNQGGVTAVEAQYRPVRDDGHFVDTLHPAARRAIREALGTFFRDGVATVAP